MTAITKIWTAPVPARQDPGRPITSQWGNDVWDNLQNLYEWIGADYAAGAVQNHDHDGVNSALVEVGPNLARNGSYEEGNTGWTFTDYTGGSHAASTANHQHGAQSMAITSTVLANGGGEALSGYIACGGDYPVPVRVFYWASVANVSSRIEVIWYDNAKAQISVGTMIDTTNTPIAATVSHDGVIAPTTARFYRLRLTGGVPGVGTSIGTVFFDGVLLSDMVKITQSMMQPGAIGQAELKTATGTNSTVSLTNVAVTLPGGAFGFDKRVRHSVGAAGQGLLATGLVSTYYDNSTPGIAKAASSLGTSYVTFGMMCTVSGTLYMQQTYPTASRPYNLGDGEIPLFIFAIVNSLGIIESIYVAAEAPWHYNGPTDIRATRKDFASGRGWRNCNRIEYEKLVNNVDIKSILNTSLGQEILLDEREYELEVTQDIKQADMGLIPHPFTGNDLTGKTIVLLDPVSPVTRQLYNLHEAGEEISDLLYDDYITLDNKQINRVTPNECMCVDLTWKNTGGI